MKKIISFLLLIGCLVMICSCDTVNNVKDKVNEITGKAPDVSVFQTAIANSNASAVVVDIDVTTAVGELSSKYEVYYNEDGSALINYSYEKFNEIGVGNEYEVKSTFTGTIRRNADGTYSEDIGVDLSQVTASAALDLTAVKKDVKINDAGDILTVTVPQAKCAEVFGTEFAKDVNLELTLRGGALNLITVTYEGARITYQYAQ